MAKTKAKAKPVVTQASSASVLPRPKYVGAQALAEPAPLPEPSDAALAPVPLKHEPTLIGLPKHLPNALPPLKASKSVPPGRESSLVGLSKELSKTPRPAHKTGIRLKAPAPPPSSAHPPAHLRHAADPTDHNVEIIDAYAAPPLPARMSSASASGDVSWDDDVVLIADGKRRNKLLAAGAVAILCALAFGIYAYATGGPETKTAEPAQKAVVESHTDTAVASPLAPEPAQVTVEAVPAQAPALSADQISGAPKLGDEPPAIAPKSTKLSKKALMRKRARARRARLSARAN